MMTLIQGIVVNIFVIFLSRLIAKVAAGFLNHRDGEEEINGNQVIYFALSMVLELMFGILVNMIAMWFLCYREFYSDAGSAKLMGSKEMITAITAF